MDTAAMQTLSPNALAGRTAVVTGGASGIGQACVERLAALGARVVIVDIDQRAAAAVCERTGATTHAVDIAAPDAVERAACDIEAHVGAVHMLVNAAGILQPAMPAPEDMPLDLLDRLFNVNFKGTYCACVAFGKRMVARRGGAIVNIASIAGMRSTPLHAYGPVKAAIIRMGEDLAAAWGRAGVRVNTLSPGSVLTPALQDAVDHGLRDIETMRGSTATGRIVHPDDVARAAVFLLSDDAAGITGVNVPVDAGWLIANSWASFGGLPPLENLHA